MDVLFCYTLLNILLIVQRIWNMVDFEKIEKTLLITSMK